MDNEEMDDPQNATWEANHKKIVEVLSKNLEYHRKSPPTVTEIAEQTGLSRKTIYRHFKSFQYHPAIQEHNAYYKLLESDVLMAITKYALSGDMRAARLYMELLGRIQPRLGLIAANTTIHVNGITLNQQMFDNLSREELSKIEGMFKMPIQITEVSRETSQL